MKRLFPAVGVAVVLLFVASACRLPTLHLREPAPVIPPLPQTSLLFDRNGTLIEQLHAAENRTLIPLSDVPPIVRDAVIAIEDSRFYQHHGVDLKALIRAAVANARSGRVVQGGSTITEQLVKITITGNDQTLARKARDALFAYELENRYSKDRILELYLNTVYFGEGAYGVEAAAQTYFARPADRLTLPEGAMLAGLIQSPSAYDPVFNPKAALSRRNVVLGRMRDLGTIDAATYGATVATGLGLHLRDQDVRYPAPYFVNYVERWFLNDTRFGSTYPARYDLLFRGGLRITTTVDLKLQAEAERAVSSVLIAKTDPYAAMTVLDPRTGEIRAMVGGRGYFSKDPYAKLNLATGGITGRQSGSAFKPFTLVAALERGISPLQVFPAPPSIQILLPHSRSWTVQNFEHANYGQMTVEQATIDSVNTVYAQLVMQTGVNNVVTTAHRMGIESPLANFPSVALGASDVNTLEMASAYGTLATEGYHTPPIGVTKITDATGKVIYQADPIPKAVINPGVAWTVDQILQKVVQEGTGIQANIGRPVGGKTGTTQDYHDAWFVGFVPQLVAAVWVGYPQGDVSMTAPRTRIPAVLGGTWPAEIWHAFMTNATADLPPLGFPQPDTRFVSVAVDVTRGCLPNEFTPPQEVQTVRFIAGTEPTVRCTEPTSPQQVPIPSVVGLSQEDATTLLESYGLVALVEPQEVDGMTPGIVLSQSPGSSTPAYPGDTVIIVVAVAPGVPPGNSPTPPPSGG